MSEDKNLNGIQDDQEVEVFIDPAKPGADKSVEVTLGEADGNANAEETESSELNEDTAVAPADAESEVNSEVEVVPEAVVSLSLQFGEKTVGLDVTDDFAVDFPALCNELGARPDAFEYEGEVSAEVRMTLIRACK